MTPYGLLVLAMAIVVLAITYANYEKTRYYAGREQAKSRHPSNFKRED